MLVKFIFNHDTKLIEKMVLIVKSEQGFLEKEKKQCLSFQQDLGTGYFNNNISKFKKYNVTNILLLLTDIFFLRQEPIDRFL